MKSIDDLEIAVAEYIDWFNDCRLLGRIGLVPPVELEEEHYRHNPVATTVAASAQGGCHTAADRISAMCPRSAA
ncbi:MAG: hypothetical protein Q8Q02_15085 [Nocardioides sp.]|nr:hypothetical protein [Nocardioides sp.]